VIVILEVNVQQVIRNTIKNLAMKTSPIPASFKDVLRFPGTDIYVFTLKDVVDNTTFGLYIQLYK